MAKELWLEFGHKMDDGGRDMLWYNEGNVSEWPYFAKALLRRLFRRQPSYRTYFKVRYGRKAFEVTI